jgi:hypothetical protein
MNFILQRLQQTSHSTTGQLSLEGALKYVTLEPPKQKDPQGNGYVCIDAGTYPVRIRWSFRFQRLTPHIEDVQGRTEIEWHIGNFPRDTDGCALIGTDLGATVDYVRASSAAFDALMTLLFAGSTLTNPGVKEMDQVWSTGTVQYIDPVATSTGENQ